MPIETITFKDKTYPKFQSEGFAAKFAFPFAQEVCKGNGLDIGCNRSEWAFPGAFLIDPLINKEFDALNLPSVVFEQWDYIFSSHCLEHLPDWVNVLNYWTTQLRCGGVLFLYLPHPSQEYWKPWNNRKHVNILYPHDIKQYLLDNGYKNVFVSECDLNNSFIAMGEKI